MLNDLILKLFTIENLIESIKFIVPTVLSVWGIIYIRKSKFYYIEKSNIKLYEDVIKDIDGFTLKYQDEDIQENLILFKGTLIFRSHQDIKQDDIDKEITICSNDDNAVWKHFEILNSSNYFTPTFEIDNNKVLIKKSLLKRNDFFTFTGLLDSKSNRLSIGQRIYNVSPKIVGLKEDNFQVYKTMAVSYTFVFSFILALYLYDVYAQQPNKTGTKNSNANQDKMETLFIKPLDIEDSYYLNGKLINIDTLESNRDLEIKRKYEDSLTKKGTLMDSLSIIFKNNPTDKNEIRLLRSMVDFSRVYYDPSDNEYYKAKKISDKQINQLTKDRSLDTSRLYKINDTVSVKYSYNDFHFSGKKKKALSLTATLLSIIELLFSFVILTAAVVNWYKFLALRRLTRILDNK